MRRSPRFFAFSTLVALLALSGCGDDGSPTETGGNLPAGTVQFTYAGPPGSGSFSASGAGQLSGQSFQSGTWAFGGIGESNGSPILLTYGMQQVGARYNTTSFIVPDAAVGSYPVETLVGCGSYGECAMIEFFFGVDRWGNVASASHVCMLEEGSINITSVEGRRIRGSFSGSGSCVNTAGAFTVTNGAFDVTSPPM